MDIDHRQITDEELCALAKSGSGDAEHDLVVRYARLVRACARPYFLEGGEMEDLIQEGMFGLIGAIRDYSPEEGASFRTFARTCVRRRIYTAIRSAAREKHAPLNDYVPIEGGGAAEAEDPEDAVIGVEKLEEFRAAAVGKLSKFELEVLQLYLEGWSCAEIGEKLGRDAKSADNAVQRIRRKMNQA